MDNSKKSIFISGASMGIGRQCALQLAQAGFKVFAGVRTIKASEEILKINSDQIKPIMVDITDKRSIDAAANVLSSENLFGLVNNAGFAILGPFEFIPLEKIRMQFEVNLFGHISVTQALLPLLRKSKGRIINMSSISGFVAFPFFGPYASSKFALEAFSDSLRRELKPWEINVSIIEPGNTKTSIWEKSFHAAKLSEDGFPSEAIKYYGKRYMNSLDFVETMMEPSVVADAVVHALTANRPKIRYVVGSNARKYSLLRRFLPDWLLDKTL